MVDNDCMGAAIVMEIPTPAGWLRIENPSWNWMLTGRYPYDETETTILGKIIQKLVISSGMRMGLEGDVMGLQLDSNEMRKLDFMGLTQWDFLVKFNGRMGFESL